MNLSRHFTLEELTASQTARSRNIPNQPDATQLEHLRNLANAILDPLRDAVGSAIRVSSGYRSPALNAAIPGSSSTSQHSLGQAADLQSNNMSALEMFKTVVRLRLPYDQVIFEAKNVQSKWVHLSHKAGANRGEIRVARFDPAGRPTSYPLISAADALAMSEPVARSGARGVGAPAMDYDEGADEPHDATVARPARKAAAKKAAPKKAAPKKAAPEKAAAEKVTAKKAAARKVSSKPAAPKKAAAKKVAPAKAAPKKGSVQKAATKTGSKAAGKAPVPKAPVKKVAPKKATVAIAKKTKAAIPLVKTPSKKAAVKPAVAKAAPAKTTARKPAAGKSPRR